LSKDGKLNYRAGAGIVNDSIPKSECEEIKTKLKAVRSAIKEASEMKSNQYELA
jgi:anthranilate/para-aminobenzoate synthase component I